MVAIRPTRTQGQEGQKFIVTKRFSGDGYNFVIGDIIVAHKAWVHKVPTLIDQRFISQFLSADDESKEPVNLVPKTDEDAVAEVSMEGAEEVVLTKDNDIKQSEVDKLANSLLG